MKSQNLKKWVMFSEVFGGLAVLITLVFLVLEIRETTELTKRANFETLQRELREWRANIISSEENLEAYHITRISRDEPQQITDPLLQTRLDQQTIVLYSIYESAFYFYQAGDLGDAEWERYRVRVCDLDTRNRWKELRQYFTEEFATFTEYCI